MDFTSTTTLIKEHTENTSYFMEGEPKRLLDISSTLRMKIVYAGIGSIGIIGNAIVILVFLSSKILRNKTTIMFIINQSTIDFITSIFVIGNVSIKGSAVASNDIYGNLLCKLWLTKLPLWSMLDASTHNLLALTFERYLGIVHPMWHKKSFTKTSENNKYLAFTLNECIIKFLIIQNNKNYKKKELLLLLMAVFPKPLFPLMGRHLMSFPLLTARHNCKGVIV